MAKRRNDASVSRMALMWAMLKDAQTRGRTGGMQLESAGCA
jgi:hypothetical protein